MRKRTTLWLALIVLFLASGVYILEHRSASQEVVLSRTRVFDITTDPITLMGMIRNGERIEMIRKDEQWYLQSPVRARGSLILVNQLAALAERLRSLDSISDEQRALRNLSLADYGLEPPAKGVFYLEAGGRREKLSLGNRTPFGAGIYGFQHDTGAVIVLPEDALSLLAPQVDDLRDRSLFPGSQRRVTRVDLYRRDVGFLQFMRRGGRWFIQQPLAWPADPIMVEQMLDALYVLQVQRFIWDAPAEADDGLQSPAFRSHVEEAQLAPDQARTRITVWVEGSDTGEELFLGRLDESTGGQLYARRGGVPSVFTVPEVLGDVVSHHVDHYRDRRFLPQGPEEVSALGMEYRDRRIQLEKSGAGGWRVVEPIRSEARPAAVQEVLRALAGLRIATFEPVDPPEPVDGLVVDVVWSERQPAEKKQISLYRVVVGDAQTNWVGRIGAEGEYLGMTGLGDGVEDWLRPCGYRSRNIWDQALGSITRMQQVTARGEVILQNRNPDNAVPDWQLADSGSGVLAREVLSRFLALLARLDAESVEVFEPPSLVPFGLHAPTATLTLRFADQNRLQQSLLLGTGPDENTTYALLQGHGYVFRLRDMDAEILQADLLLPDTEAVPAQQGQPAPLLQENGMPDEIPILLLEDVDLVE